MSNDSERYNGVRLTLSMVVRNEADRYLRPVLESARSYITDAVIIDDNSTDNTVSLCHELLAGIPHTVVENRESSFHDEWKLRSQQWEETISTDPDWILFLDADEIFEESFKDGLKNLLADRECGNWLFRLYDFWDEDHYRDDFLWSAHQIYRPFMHRYQKGFPYTFRKAGQHCGRMPENTAEFPCKLSNYRLKHLGWARKEDRIAKYERYMELDPDGEYGSLQQYQSILDGNPNLMKWEESAPEISYIDPAPAKPAPANVISAKSGPANPAAASPILTGKEAASPSPTKLDMPKKKLLIGSPICQAPGILYAFLYSLRRLETPGCEIHYHFIDDNHNAQSRVLLKEFQKQENNVTVETPPAGPAAQRYEGHDWNLAAISKVAGYKDNLIERARGEDFDYLFLIDSDILMHPHTVRHLIEAEKDIISEVYWTKWEEHAIEQPQVWLYDFHTQYQMLPGEKVSKVEELRRTIDFFNKLREPGVYEVGGLGACTLISRHALAKEISFQRISNLSFWGEDRHFCVRARVLGLNLFADTHYPAYHVYRLTDLEKGMAYLKNTGFDAIRAGRGKTEGGDETEASRGAAVSDSETTALE